MLKLLAPSVLRQALVIQAQSIGFLAPACNAVMGAASTSGNTLTSSAVCSGHQYQQHSNYGTEAAPSASSSGDKQPSSSDTSSIGNDKVQKLADEVLGLTVLEASWLSDILRKKLNIAKPAFGAMPAMPFMAAAAAPAAASVGGDAKAPAAEEKKEKTEFDIKLESFSAEGKIKVIKEIRALTNLGLKEAKELVEKAPVVVKSAVPKADAENLKKQLEAAGGKVTLA